MIISWTLGKLLVIRGPPIVQNPTHPSSQQCTFFLYFVHFHSSYDTPRTWKNLSFIVQSSWFTLTKFLLDLSTFVRSFVTITRIWGVTFGPNLVGGSTNFKGPGRVLVLYVNWNVPLLKGETFTWCMIEFLAFPLYAPYQRHPLDDLRRIC